MIPQNFSNQLRNDLASGKTLDEALVLLRASGASVVECIATIRSVRQCALPEAKQFVHDSPAWADLRERNNKFHEELSSILDPDT